MAHGILRLGEMLREPVQIENFITPKTIDLGCAHWVCIEEWTAVRVCKEVVEHRGTDEMGFISGHFSS